jgi:hypothetical protein
MDYVGKLDLISEKKGIINAQNTTIKLSNLHFPLNYAISFRKQNFLKQQWFFVHKLTVEFESFDTHTVIWPCGSQPGVCIPLGVYGKHTKLKKHSKEAHLSRIFYLGYVNRRLL